VLKIRHYAKPQNVTGYFKKPTMHAMNIPDDIREQYRYAIKKAREDRPRYFDWIKNEIETVINLITPLVQGVS
jgi:hypothetical protein